MNWPTEQELREAAACLRDGSKTAGSYTVLSTSEQLSEITVMFFEILMERTRPLIAEFTEVLRQQRNPQPLEDKMLRELQAMILTVFIHGCHMGMLIEEKRNERNSNSDSNPGGTVH